MFFFIERGRSAKREEKEEEVTDVVDVKKGMQVTHLKRGQSGMVLQHTATDVLV